MWRGEGSYCLGDVKEQGKSLRGESSAREEQAASTRGHLQGCGGHTGAQAQSRGRSQLVQNTQASQAMVRNLDFTPSIIGSCWNVLDRNNDLTFIFKKTTLPAA